VDKSIKFALPRAEIFLDVTARAIIYNIRNGNEAVLEVPPLVQRAYTLVNETGVIPYTEYPADTTITS
jgi:hypothetical protein